MPSTDAPLELRTYFGPADAPLYGALHLPASRRVRGAVLLVPPLAKEQYDAQRGLRRLAALLAADGLAVLRFDYLGTGDSAGPAGLPDAAAGWIVSVRHADAYLRDLGVRAPAVVALRAGAAVAGAAGLTPPAAVLWDPIGGRPFTRAQGALARMAIGAGPDTWIGLDVHPTAVAELATLPADALAAPRVLIAERPGAAPVGPVGADRIAVDGMPEFVEPSAHLVRIPDAAVADIAAWLGAALPDGERVTVAPEIRARARWGDVEERIEDIGGAAAIRTVPAVGAPRRSVLLCATANDARHGPNRAWVALAREVAAAGGAALRFDRRGAGESGPVDAGEAVALFPPAGVDDAVAAARALDGPLLTAGVCSGSWYAAHAARAAAADTTVLVNTVLYSWRLKPGITAAPAQDLGVPRTDPAFARSPRGRLKELLRTRLPYPAWRLLGRRGVTQVPEVLLRPVVAAGTDAVLVLAPPDAAWFDSQRGPEGLRRLLRLAGRQRAGTVRAVRPGAGDHPGYHPDVRADVATAILQWCEQR
ncbi:alpha/beta hydrolase [Tsukamurella sp. USMM236]|uniref:alpha/beta hydrolase n=1 Tax=Tsukamurella sp. USMM236 TaxID=3081301 RepID=UPI0030174EC7